MMAVILPPSLYAQPSNDVCSNATVLENILNFCSESGAFSNENATSDPTFPIFSCPTQNNDDVWFKFTAIAPNVSISVTGRTGGNFPGGTLRNPEVQLLFADNSNCANFQSIECDDDPDNDHFSSINRGGLVPGNEYYIRVQGRNNRKGTFQLCVNNFTPAFPPESDCSASHLLCDKSTFFIDKIVGAGDDPDEARGSCLDAGLFSNSESSSTWYKWIAGSSGTLSFTLTPENPEDDLDFALYELPNGVNDCDDKKLLRCVASGENQGEPFSNWARCTGATGLRDDDNDDSEEPGCQPNDNNFAQSITMEEGKAYALLINNFSETENGFTIEFGGTGEFLGPQPDVELIIDKSTNIICVGEEVGFSGQASSFQLGQITDYQWSFGAGASPSEATGVGPHTVLYNTPGEKTVVLTLTTNLGCIISDVKESIVMVEPCCETINGITGDGEVTNVICGTSKGAVDLTVTSASPIFSYQWSNNQTTEDIDDLGPDEYAVTVTNFATCTEVFTFPVDSVAPFLVETDITKPTCNGGRDGAIRLNISNGVEPILVDFGNGFDNMTTLEQLPIGNYSATVQDGNGCAQTFEIEVNELVLELDSSVAIIEPPSCFGFENGRIALNFVNGLAPYSYDWNDGNGFVPNNSLTAIPAGTYTVNVVDQNLCKGNFQFNIEAPEELVLSFDTLHISCAGQTDGELTALVTGGTGTYIYNWSNGSAASTINNLPAGNYSLTVMDANQCEVEGSPTIIEPSSINLQVADIQNVICFGDATGVVTVAGTGGSPNYQYSVDGINFQDSPSLANLAAGEYTITLRDQRGCVEDVTAIINQPDELTVDAGPDLTIDLGYTGQLNAVTTPFFRPVVFDWSPSEYLSCMDCADPVASPPIPTTFVVTVRDETNCVAQDSLQVFITKNRPLFFPTAFSPNTDGKNDFFTVYGGPAADIIEELKVFDRWGNMVYEAYDIPLNDDAKGWDGNFNGERLPNGVYAFMARIRFIDNVSEVYGGDVTIIR